MKKLIVALSIFMVTGLSAQEYTHYQVRYATHPKDVKTYDTQRVRSEFLVQNLFQKNQVNMTYTMHDRFIVGGAMSVGKTLKLETIDPIKSPNFTAHREVGIINVGGKGTVKVGNKNYVLDHKEALYIGRGNEEVYFSSSSASKPALFYFNSATAHKEYPTRKITQKEAIKVEAGSLKESNARTIIKYIVNETMPTCQLQLGMTELKEGSVWNTMPAHTHGRRMETYFYFNLPEKQSIAHFMGEAEESRVIWVHNQEAVISPEWSIHSGAGTSNYDFIWGMAGENLDYTDMDKVQPLDIK